MKLPCFAVLLAGGMGKRFDSSEPKQFSLLCRKPIYRICISQFEKIGFLDGIILVVPSIYIKKMKKQINKSVIVIPGGKTRQESSFNALEYLNNVLNGEEALVAIHDVARPLIKRSIIERSFEIALEKGACLVAEELTDTIYKKNALNNELKHIPRESLIAAQTPQTFRFSLIWEAHKQAKKERFEAATDDVSLIIRKKQQVELLMHDSPNPKLTYPIDIIWAEVYLKSKENQI